MFWASRTIFHCYRSYSRTDLEMYPFHWKQLRWLYFIVHCASFAEIQLSKFPVLSLRLDLKRFEIRLDISDDITNLETISYVSCDTVRSLVSQ